MARSPTVQAALEFHYREIGIDQIALLQPLWEKLNEHHVQLSKHFAAEMRQRAFAQRAQEFLTKAKLGRIKIDVASLAVGGSLMAYCVSSVSPDRVGEIDSIFVEKSFRSYGIGATLMERALAWLKECGVTSNRLTVVYPNLDAMAFYARFGFFPATITLRQKDNGFEEIQPSHCR